MFGYIGDNIGRKSAIIISTLMMAISCFFMSILPTYAEIGIFASIGMGSMIAISGTLARRKLRETPDFLKRQAPANKIHAPNVSKRTSLAYFLIFSGYPLCFYLIFIHSSNILKYSMHYTPEQIINHNLLLTITSFLDGMSLICLLNIFTH